MTTKVDTMMLLDVTAAGRNLIEAADVNAQRVLLGVLDTAPARTYLNGLTLSNNISDATNDIDVAVGEATSDSIVQQLILLSAGITKRLDAAWAVGNNQGGLDTGSIANTTYHVWLIKRSDTGVVDVLFSTSATSPTMPANYDHKRRIGSILRAGGAIRPFKQWGNMFKLSTNVTDRNDITAASNILLTLSVPLGISVSPILSMDLQQNAAGRAIQIISDGVQSASDMVICQSSIAGEWSQGTSSYGVFTNTSGQIRYTLSIQSGSLNFARVFTHGWIDTRGTNG